MLEVVFDQLTDVLGVGEIESCVYLIQNVNRGGFEEEEGKNQSQGDKGSEKQLDFYSKPIYFRFYQCPTI